ncbi:hypothetical protein WA026_009611 [Henosepilachna vigintioctopunctata]|uniref:Uncharacterized protein n=1 Tax=Henosepilachna vigintioctopunctata TaxID=420089 RepID=A0AAW1U5E2_9CUCU
MTQKLFTKLIPDIFRCVHRKEGTKEIKRPSLAQTEVMSFYFWGHEFTANKSQWKQTVYSFRFFLADSRMDEIFILILFQSIHQEATEFNVCVRLQRRTIIVTEKSRLGECGTEL